MTVPMIRHPQIARDGGMIENIENRNSKHDQKSAIPLRQYLSAGLIRKPAVEVIAQERHKQCEAINQAIGGGVEAASFQGQNVGKESVDRVVGEEKARHKEEDLEEVE